MNELYDGVSSKTQVIFKVSVINKKKKNHKTKNQLKISVKSLNDF